MAPDLVALARHLDEDAFRARFRRSPVKRAKRRGLLRNVSSPSGTPGTRARGPILERLAGDEDPIVREHASGRWRGWPDTPAPRRELATAGAASPRPLMNVR